jgi:nucleotide-binding universal stress UspA family protein
LSGKFEHRQPVLVGFDGSAHAGDALALGSALAEALSTRLVVVSAYTPEELLWEPATAEPLSDAERDGIKAQAEAAVSDLGDVEMRFTPSPSAAGALLAEAERERAQIIVVGATHRGPVGRLVLGTVTQGVLDAAPCAVAVAPAGLASKGRIRFARVGVGFDDTSEAREALDVARSFAGRVQAELRLMWAAHLTARALPLAFASYVMPDYLEQVRSEVEGRLDRAAAPIREELEVRTQIVGGDTTEALVQESESLDLLVLGSRAYGPIERVLLGSVSRRLLNEARCPVLIVPRGVTADGGTPERAEAAALASEH